jgi:hypothetical protein
MSDVAAYHVFVCVVSSAERYVDCSPHTSLHWKQLEDDYSSRLESREIIKPLLVAIK